MAEQKQKLFSQLIYVKHLGVLESFLKLMSREKGSERKQKAKTMSRFVRGVPAGSVALPLTSFRKHYTSRPREKASRLRLSARSHLNGVELWFQIGSDFFPLFRQTTNCFRPIEFNKRVNHMSIYTCYLLYLALPRLHFSIEGFGSNSRSLSKIHWA